MLFLVALAGPHVCCRETSMTSHLEPYEVHQANLVNPLVGDYWSKNKSAALAADKTSVVPAPKKDAKPGISIS